MRDNEGNIIQLKYKDHPWKVLMVCMLLNRTSRTQVEPILDELFNQFPSIYHFAHAGYKGDEYHKLIQIIKPLGLYNRRAKMLIAFANDVLDKGISVETILKRELTGVGDYASDCWMLMYRGQRFLTCKDGALQNYLNKLLREE